MGIVNCKLQIEIPKSEISESETATPHSPLTTHHSPLTTTHSTYLPLDRLTVKEIDDWPALPLWRSSIVNTSV